MKKQLKLHFSENLILSDFFLIHSSKKALKLNSSVSLKNQKYFLLDIFKLQKELKQFIRMIRFLCVDLRTACPPQFLFLNTENSEYPNLIKHFFDTYIKKDLGFNGDYQNVSKRDLTEKSIITTVAKKILISFTDLINSQAVASSFFNNKLFLINIMNIRSGTLKSSSFYSINNLIDTNRKIFFILTLIEDTLKNSILNNKQRVNCSKSNSSSDDIL